VLGLAPALLIPADAGRISAVVGIAVFAVARFAGPRAGLALGSLLAAWIILAPLVVSVLLPRLPALDGFPPSAAHRILIWDFTTTRIAERPVLGWGVEGARAVPGGRDVFAPETLDRFGLRSAASIDWFGRPQAQRLPLHPHNAALHLWLELGLVGAVLGAWLAVALGLAAGRMGAGATGALAAGAVTGMLSYGVWQEWWIGFGLLVAAVLAGLRPERDRCA
jgi:O-antigen ligase